MQNPNQDSGVVIVPADHESQFVRTVKPPVWPLALAGLLLVVAGATGFLAWRERQTRSSYEAQIIKLDKANRELNDQNAQIKAMYDQQLQAERDKATSLETQAKTTMIAVNEWNTVQGGVGGIGYKPGTAPAGTEEPLLTVASSMRVFRVDLALPKLADFPEYSAEVKGPQGQAPSLVRATKSTNGVSLLIAMSSVGDGKYAVKLFGTKDGQRKEIGKGYNVPLTFPK